MRSLLRHAILAWVILAAIGFGASQASAGEAGLVVEHGDGSVTYVLVVFPEDEIASLDLLRRSGLSLTTLASGGLGEAVCSIDEEGCSLADCQTRLCQTGDPGSPFWKFFRVSDGGEWVASPLGASASRVGDGGIDLWAWTGGEPTVVVLNLDRIAELVDAPAQLPAEGTYVAWYDASGNQIEGPSEESDDPNQIVTGIALLVVFAIAAALMIRRRRQESPLLHRNRQ